MAVIELYRAIFENKIIRRLLSVPESFGGTIPIFHSKHSPAAQRGEAKCSTVRVVANVYTEPIIQRIVKISKSAYAKSLFPSGDQSNSLSVMCM